MFKYLSKEAKIIAIPEDILTALCKYFLCKTFIFKKYYQKRKKIFASFDKMRKRGKREKIYVSKCFGWFFFQERKTWGQGEYVEKEMNHEP